MPMFFSRTSSIFNHGLKLGVFLWIFLNILIFLSPNKHCFLLWCFPIHQVPFIYLLLILFKTLVFDFLPISPFLNIFRSVLRKRSRHYILSNVHSLLSINRVSKYFFRLSSDLTLNIALKLYIFHFLKILWFLKKFREKPLSLSLVLSIYLILTDLVTWISSLWTIAGPEVIWFSRINSFSQARHMFTFIFPRLILFVVTHSKFLNHIVILLIVIAFSLIEWSTFGMLFRRIFPLPRLSIFLNHVLI